MCIRDRVRFSGDDVGPAPQEFGGEADRHDGRFFKDGGFGERQLLSLIHI